MAPASAFLEPLLAHEFHHIGLAARWGEVDLGEASEAERLAHRFLRFFAALAARLCALD